MIIGLTGGIATGKSTVAKMLKELGATIIDADKVAREVVEPHEPTLKKIVERFGADIVHHDGRLNREKLGSIVFQDGQARSDLNHIIHPAIRHRMQQKIEEAIRAGDDLIVLDIPLLFEGKNRRKMDKILVVYIPEELQKKRLMERDNIDASLAEQKMSSQIPIEQKKNLGDAYIDNSYSLDETKQQLEDIMKRWKAEEQ